MKLWKFRASGAIGRRRGECEQPPFEKNLWNHDRENPLQRKKSLKLTVKIRDLVENDPLSKSSLIPPRITCIIVLVSYHARMNNYHLTFWGRLATPTMGQKLSNIRRGHSLESSWGALSNLELLVLWLNPLVVKKWTCPSIVYLCTTVCTTLLYVRPYIQAIPRNQGHAAMHWQWNLNTKSVTGCHRKKAGVLR
jgi:hypothetical protein